MCGLNNVLKGDFRKKSPNEAKSELEKICVNELRKPELFLANDKILIYGISITNQIMAYFNSNTNSIKFKKYLKIIDKKIIPIFDYTKQINLFSEYNLGAFPEKGKLTLRFAPTLPGGYILNTIENKNKNKNLDIESFYFYLFKDGIKSSDELKTHNFKSSLEKSILAKPNEDYFIFSNITVGEKKKILKTMQPFC